MTLHDSSDCQFAFPVSWQGRWRYPAQVSARPHPSLSCHMTFGDKHAGRVCFDLRYHPMLRLTGKLFKELQHFFFLKSLKIKEAAPRIVSQRSSTESWEKYSLAKAFFRTGKWEKKFNLDFILKRGTYGGRQRSFLPHPACMRCVYRLTVEK